MDDCIILKHGMLNLQACSKLSKEDTVKWVQRNSPAGTTNNWNLSTEESQKPVKCNKYPDRTHYTFQC